MIIPKQILLLLLQGAIQQAPRRIVVDVDAGTDDVQALTVLLNADANNLVNIEAIICVEGNTNRNYVEKNVVRLLETAGRLDIPIYTGVHRPMRTVDPPLLPWFGIDGFGDIKNFTKEPDVEKWIRKENPMKVLYDLVKSNPDEITIVAIGPLSNIALTAMLYNDFMENIRDLWIMGGNYGEKMVEFNFLGDPEAAQIVFNASVKPTHLLTWQACIDTQFTLEWRFNISITNPIWDLIELAERSQFGDFDPNATYEVCDMALSVALIYPEIITKQTEDCAQIELKDHDRRGEVIINKNCSRNNINFIESLDTDEYAKHYINQFEHACDSGLCKNIYL